MLNQFISVLVISGFVTNGFSFASDSNSDLKKAKAKLAALKALCDEGTDGGLADWASKNKNDTSANDADAAKNGFESAVKAERTQYAKVLQNCHSECLKMVINKKAAPPSLADCSFPQDASVVCGLLSSKDVNTTDFVQPYVKTWATNNSCTVATVTSNAADDSAACSSFVNYKIHSKPMDEMPRPLNTDFDNPGTEKCAAEFYDYFNDQSTGPCKSAVQDWQTTHQAYVKAFDIYRDAADHVVKVKDCTLKEVESEYVKDFPDGDKSDDEKSFIAFMKGCSSDSLQRANDKKCDDAITVATQDVAKAQMGSSYCQDCGIYSSKTMQNAALISAIGGVVAPLGLGLMQYSQNKNALNSYSNMYNNQLSTCAAVGIPCPAPQMPYLSPIAGYGGVGLGGAGILGGAYAGGYPGMGIAGGIAGGYPGYALAGGYPGYAMAGGYPGGAIVGGIVGGITGGYPGYALAGGYPGYAVAGGYPGAIAGGYPGAITGGYPGAIAGGYPGYNPLAQGNLTQGATNMMGLQQQMYENQLRMGEMAGQNYGAQLGGGGGGYYGGYSPYAASPYLGGGGVVSGIVGGIVGSGYNAYTNPYAYTPYVSPYATTYNTGCGGGLSPAIGCGSGANLACYANGYPCN